MSVAAHVSTVVEVVNTSTIIFWLVVHAGGEPAKSLLLSFMRQVAKYRVKKCKENIYSRYPDEKWQKNKFFSYERNDS
jgi:hypothetical protein